MYIYMFMSTDQDCKKVVGTTGSLPGVPPNSLRHWLLSFQVVATAPKAMPALVLETTGLTQVRSAILRYRRKPLQYHVEEYSRYMIL